MLGERKAAQVGAGTVEGRDPLESAPSKDDRPHQASPEPLGEYHLLGPPGTGKTTALTRSWIPKAIERFGAKSVAVCSLTKAAAVELASRQVVALPHERVGTLHSFARRALTDFMGKPDLAQTPERIEQWNEDVAQGRSGFKLQSSSKATSDDQQPFMGVSSQSQGKALSRAHRAAQANAVTGDEVLAEIETLRHRMVPAKDWPKRLHSFWAAWQEWKQEFQLFDFTDLISKAMEAGSPPPQLEGQDVEALFVDEAQDLTKLELALVRSWQDSVKVCVLCGDVNQAIYGFRGGEANAFHDPDTFPKDRTFVLGQSYRVPPVIQSRAEAWLKQSRSCVSLDYKPRESEEEGTVMRDPLTMAGRDSRGVVARVVAELDRLGAPMRTGDHSRVMILATAGYMLTPIIAELRAQRILYYNPFQKDRGDWNPLKTSQRHIVSLFTGPCPYLTGDDGPGGREPRLWTWSELKQWTDVLQAKGLLLHGAKANIITRESKKRGRAIVDNGDLERIFSDAASIRSDIIPMLRDRSRANEALAWYRKQMTVAHSRRLAFTVSVAQRDLMQIMREPRVVVGTIHSVKGGTAGTVILSPDLSRKHSEERKHSQEGFDGIIRLFYVGMTRASSRLILLSPQRKFSRLGPHVEW
jgi:superfamily I DNA/RNA helicase